MNVAEILKEKTDINNFNNILKVSGQRKLWVPEIRIKYMNEC